MTLDSVIDEALAAGRVVGTSVLVSRRGELVYERHAGHADREAGTLVDERTLFRLASMTKPMVSVAALALVEQGRFGLDTPVRELLPDFRPRLADGREPDMTIEHLLTHTSGLAYGFLTPDNEPYRSAGVSDGFDLPEITLDENLRRLATVPLAFEPGSAWRYSLSLDVMGAALEAATGDSLPDLVRRLVTQPLGLSDTAFAPVDPARLATPYVDGGPARRMADADVIAPEELGPIHYAPRRALTPGAYHSGGGGMIGTAHEYVRFLEALRGGGAPIISPETVALMTSDRIPGLLVELLGPGFGFGLGFSVVRDADEAGRGRAAGSYGWGGIYGTTFFVDPQAELSVVIVTNTALEGMYGQFTLDVESAIYA
jgi:CubicO group peptidase (beta-lactamase class C family)